jgi:hypothetical protein
MDPPEVVTHEKYIIIISWQQNDCASLLALSRIGFALILFERNIE